MISERKGQIAIFIIIAIILIVVIILFFVLRQRAVPEVPGVPPGLPDPEAYIEKCARDSANDALDKMMLQGGYINPENYVEYEDKNISLLCDTNLLFTPCINQEPLYLRHLREEILDYIEPEIEECFDEIEQQYKDEQYIVSVEKPGIDLQLKTGKVEIDIDSEFVITKGDTTIRYEAFSTIFNHPIYDLGKIAVEIVNQEVQFGSFQHIGYSLTYYPYMVDYDRIGDYEIYEIKDDVSGEELYIAIRNVVI